MMVLSREQKKAAQLHEKLQILRSITNSKSICNSSIIVDAAKYIEELKHKVIRLNQDVAASSQLHSSWPLVAVEKVENSYIVNIHSEGGGPGLLVTILEVFQDLGLNVQEASVSCTHTFLFEALGNQDEESRETINAHVVKQAIAHAIRKNWRGSNEKE